MKKIKTIYFVSIASFLLLLSSCKKMIAIAPPNNSLVSSEVFDNDGTAITAQLAVYAKLESALYNYEMFTGLSADELTNYSTSQINVDLYHNSLNAQTDGGVSGFWSVFYNIIYQENSILEGISNSGQMSDRVKKLMNGEAFFMRAFSYWQLVNAFGDVPLVLTTDYKASSNLPRSPKAQVYQQVISDLYAAQGLLSPGYLDASDNTGSTDRVRPTVWAADALLARVCLYYANLSGNQAYYAKADSAASIVIADASMFTLSSLTGTTSVFKKNSSEAIWQLMEPSGTLYTPEGQNYILTAPPGNGSATSPVSLSSQLLAAFEPNDQRKINWIGSYSQSGTTWYFAYKYKDNNKATALSEYVMVLRLAEQYLIRSEAEANTNDAADAVKDLNVIRNRAGLPNYSGATDPASLETAILHERQVELFTEEHRWFDLKRTNTVDAVMNVVTPQKGGTWQSYQKLYPLSVTDLQYNRNLVQNTGY